MDCIVHGVAKSQKWLSNLQVHDKIEWKVQIVPICSLPHMHNLPIINIPHQNDRYLLKLMDLSRHWHIIITRCPWFPLQFKLNATHSVGLNKCIIWVFIITVSYRVGSLSWKYYMSSFLISPARFLATTYLSIVSTVLPFSEGPILEIIHM